jgi:2-polyprenyl-3-methyl-5-hydroxy-6-metoxy-1,4-benzoquinol methylase
MPTPFPGMDPYLERAGVWEEVHTRLIVAMADALGPQVRAKYRVGVEQRTYPAVLTPDEYELVGKPDVLVIGPRHQALPVQATATAGGIAPDEVEYAPRHSVLRWPANFMRCREAVCRMGHMLCRPFYGEYAWAYDLLITRPVTRECAYIGALLSQRGVDAGTRLLDAGCGTGRYAVGLARMGYTVTGLDRSAHLIAEAEKQARNLALPISFMVGEVLGFSSASPYDGILCRGVLNDLCDEQSRAEVFCSFARVLRPGGVLILDVREWHATARRKSREPVFEKAVDTARGQLIFRSVTRLDHQRQQLLVAERHALYKDGGAVVSSYDFTMRCWTQEELHRSLTRAGFNAIMYLGAYDSLVPPGASDRLVGVASLRDESPHSMREE